MWLGDPTLLPPGAIRPTFQGMTTPQTFDYHRLSIAERLQLVEDIWDSIAADADTETLPITEEEKALLDERLADLEANPAAGAPWAEVRARIVNRSR